MRINRSLPDLGPLPVAPQARESSAVDDAERRLGDVRQLAWRPMTLPERQRALKQPQAGRKKVGNWATFGGLHNCKHAEWAWHAGHRWQVVGHGAMAAGGFVGILATGDMSFLIGGGARYLLEVCRGRAFSRRTEGGYREDFIVHRLMGLHEDINALLAAHGPQGPWLAQAGDALQGLRDDIKHHADRRVRESELIPKALAVAEGALGAALAGRPAEQHYLDGPLWLPWEGRSSTAKPKKKLGDGGDMSLRGSGSVTEPLLGAK